MRDRLQGHGATIVVSALSTVLAVTLILTTGVLAAALDPNLMEGSATFRMMFLAVSFVFIGIALYVAAIVTANTFSTIIAGRTRTIALYRLIGSTSNRMRASVAREGLVMGALGALAGFVVATGLVAGGVAIAEQLGGLPAGRGYPLFDPLTLVAVALVIATTWIAAWVGTKRVGQVSPIAATGAAVEPSPEVAGGRVGRTVTAIIFVIIGVALMGLGIALSPMGIVVAFFGGMFSFTGIMLAAHRIMPPMLALSGKLLGKSPVARLASANATRHPERATRATIGLVIGVTLVTMFAVALSSFESMMLTAFGDDPASQAVLGSTIATVTVVLTALVGFSAVIAAVGLVNTLSLGVIQRTRELGLLRTLGFTGAQVRGLVIVEAAQMTLTALVFGVVLGGFYGWIAATSLLASEVGIQPPGIPLLVIAGIAVFGIALAALASFAPSKRAVRVAPVEALAAA
ncbi:ABC transporter permease [Leucobacter chinensis]|uniref:ABC transporter permease n=1 Tax=Leucobacter chinensis TaxID=2851010 RepID=UPI001C220A65